MIRLFSAGFIPVAVVLAACSSTTVVTSPPVDASVPDSSTPQDSSIADTSPGSDSSCPTINGATGCDDVIGAMCGRYVQCCVTGSTCSTSCASWACSVTACKAEYVTIGTDCSSAIYSSKNVCQSGATTCEGDIPLIACSDAIAGKANFPASCKAFFAQF